MDNSKRFAEEFDKQTRAYGFKSVKEFLDFGEKGADRYERSFMKMKASLSQGNGSFKNYANGEIPQGSQFNSSTRKNGSIMQNIINKLRNAKRQ